MTKPFVLLLILALFLLAACSPAEQIPVSEAPAQEEESRPTEVASTEIPPTDAPSMDVTPTEASPPEMEPTETVVSEPGGGVSAAGIQMECTLVSDQPDAPAEFVAIFGVTEDDWVIGPETAAVTFVEYGDFQ